MDEAWYVYLLQCGDGSLYAGIARDVDRRLQQHREGKGARYTRGRGPLQLVEQAGPFSRNEALRWEWTVKQRPRRQKREAFTSMRRGGDHL
jgi:putative endonuclease